MTIPFLDLPAQYRTIQTEIQTAITAVLESSQFVLGEAVTQFEQAFAAYCQTDYAIAVNSGTSALHLALLAAGVGPGDQVITVSMTFVATVAAILYTGARPVFVDINPVTGNLDVHQIEAAITEHTRAILPVHLYGQPAEMDPIRAIARRYHLVVIEDAAQAHGAEYRGQRVGGLGDLGCFSFYPGKNLGAYGEGGMVVTNHPDYARQIQMLRDWGQDRKYHHVLKGYNYRMDGIQGAVLGVKLRYLDQWTAARRSLAVRYNQGLAGTSIGQLQVHPDCQSVYHLYAIRVAQRDRLRSRLQAQGIQTGIHYPVPVHLQPAYAELGNGEGSLPHSEALANQQVSLPLYPELAPDQVDRVIQAILEEPLP